jgi:hypothetical protein
MSATKSQLNFLNHFKKKSPEKKHNKSGLDYSDSNNNQDFFHEESLCITEENRYENAINPIRLADLGWSDTYKLDKLLK